ncbi:MAG: CDP-alcohol phosphatidyltransferase family protein [Acidobacteriota bacterium]|jgi:phosphatidylglycerophosphate synthase
MNWKTKPTDRFVLKFIKVYLSAPISARVVKYFPNIRPAVCTCAGACLGMAGGLMFGLGYACFGALAASLAQVLDGVDGQVARLTGRVSSKGAMLDSFLDRYMDFSLIFGLYFHCLQFSTGLGDTERILGPGLLTLVAVLAVAGSSQISYSTARAASLKLDFQRPESAGKGSRTTAIILCGFLTPLWIHFPFIALLYLALHPNIAVISAMIRLQKTKDTHRSTD